MIEGSLSAVIEPLLAKVKMGHARFLRQISTPSEISYDESLVYVDTWGPVF